MPEWGSRTRAPLVRRGLGQVRLRVDGVRCRRHECGLKSIPERERRTALVCACIVHDTPEADDYKNPLPT